MARVLLVEDDDAVRDAVALALEALGHDVEPVAGGVAALTRLEQALRPDVVLLDVMMPGMDGFEACRRIRSAGNGVPIIMLTARTDPVDVVVGLESGADDYVTKPAEPRVLDARIKAVLRRMTPAEVRPLLQIGDLVFDEAAMRVTRGGSEVALTPMELKLFTCLARHSGQVMTRSMLLDLVWDYAFAGDSRLVDATIQRLRVKVERDPARPALIHTVRGLGYRMDLP